MFPRKGLLWERGGFKTNQRQNYSAVEYGPVATEGNITRNKIQHLLLTKHVAIPYVIALK
jgi:hypothetical protein